MIICCCDRASTDTCDRCLKGKLLNPDRIFLIPNWKRKLTDITKRVVKNAN